MDQHILDSLFTDIDRLSPEYVRFWKDLCTLEGRSDEVDNLNRVADFIVSRAESLGLEVIREHVHPDYPEIWAETSRWDDVYAHDRLWS